MLFNFKDKYYHSHSIGSFSFNTFNVEKIRHLKTLFCGEKRNYINSLSPFLISTACYWLRAQILRIFNLRNETEFSEICIQLISIDIHIFSRVVLVFLLIYLKFWFPARRSLTIWGFKEIQPISLLSPLIVVASEFTWWSVKSLLPLQLIRTA